MSEKKLPNGPKTHPWLQTFRWLQNPFGYMEECRQLYGDMFTLRIGPVFTPQVFISNPKGIREIFGTNPKHLDSGESAGIKSPLLGRESLLSLEGQKHKKRRKLLMPPFHGERMRNYGNLIEDITKEIIKEWKVNEAFPVLPSMQEISFKVILKAVFGLEEGDRFDLLQERLLAMLNPKMPLLGILLFLFPILRKDLGSWSPQGQFMLKRQQVDELIYAEIAERRDNPDSSRTDILSLMMAARDEDGNPMTDEELRDELMTLLVAGHETTASTLAWAFYWIHKNKEIKNKLVEELETIGNNFDPNEIIGLPYLNAVCQETLRLYPVVILALNRVVKSSLEIMGQKFEPGVLLIPSIYLVHHREDLYPNSKQFKPERFLEKEFSSYEYLPFGGGNRRCLGYAFAMFEMKLVLATVLSHFDMELVDNKSLKPVRVGVLFRPKEGVRMVVKQLNKERFDRSKNLTISETTS